MNDDPKNKPIVLCGYPKKRKREKEKSRWRQKRSNEQLDHSIISLEQKRLSHRNELIKSGTLLFELGDDWFHWGTGFLGEGMGWRSGTTWFIEWGFRTGSFRALKVVVSGGGGSSASSAIGNIDEGPLGISKELKGEFWSFLGRWLENLDGEFGTSSSPDSSLSS